ncbi:AraC family transcriptional regulator [Oscillospiraceae bacterium PP1C4]
MENVHSIQYKFGSKEEQLPNFNQAFPYIASYAELDKFIGRQVPWHWHKEVELFFIESGVLEYYTPRGKTVFPAGSGGLVNSNVLHMTKPQDGVINTTQQEHIFNTSIIGGQQGSIFEQKYVTPLTAASQIEIIGLHPQSAKEAELLELLKLSFKLSKEAHSYEMKLRNMLTEIWCGLLDVSEDLRSIEGGKDKSCDKVKMMLIYIHEHFTEKITIAKIAAAAYVSQRECFRVFRKNLHMTPAEYLTDYRLRQSCHLLAESNQPITEIGHACGLGSSSYFGKVFRDAIGKSPMEYRNKWQNRDTSGQK